MAGKTKRWILTGALIIVMAIIAAGVSVAVKYYFVTKGDSSIAKPDGVVLSTEEAPLGTPVTATATFVCPWTRRPIAAELMAGKGAQVVGTPKIARETYGWGRSVWIVKATMQAYRDGAIAEGALTVTFSDPGKTKGNEKMSLPVPGFEATQLDIDDPDSLAVASELSLRERVGNALPWLIAAAVLIVALIVVILFIRRRERRRDIILPPWTIALADIRELGDNLRKGLITGEFCITKLTDVVRRYLEKRFHLHAQTQTTKEFLVDLEKPGGPLAEEHRCFLKEFLTAADLVKFANCPADNSLIENTIGKANQLVESTKLTAKAPQEPNASRQGRAA